MKFDPNKKIILFDFDGVIHSYSSGWKGARNIPDPPVRGAIEFLIELCMNEEYKVCIYSSRSCQFGGKRAMKKWVIDHFIQKSILSWEQTPDPYKTWIGQTAFADPWEYEVEYAAKRLIKSISWPTKKPPAYLTVDDRAICFDGSFSALRNRIKDFKTWYGKTQI